MEIDTYPQVAKKMYFTLLLLGLYLLLGGRCPSYPHHFWILSWCTKTGLFSESHLEKKKLLLKLRFFRWTRGRRRKCHKSLGGKMKLSHHQAMIPSLYYLKEAQLATYLFARFFCIDLKVFVTKKIVSVHTKVFSPYCEKAKNQLQFMNLCPYSCDVRGQTQDNLLKWHVVTQTTNLVPKVDNT